MSSTGTAAFFGRVTASVSHELKNVMATVSESAGLLGDLLAASQDQGSLDRSELDGCCATIIDEVRRGFGIIRNLNTFAHQADHPLAEADLEETVALAAGIAGYLRRACPIDVASPTGNGPRVRTDPILLLELLHRLLAAAFVILGSEGTCAVTTRAAGSGAVLHLTGPDPTEWLDVAGDPIRRLAEDLGATIAHDDRRQGLTINLRATLEARFSAPDPASPPAS